MKTKSDMIRLAPVVFFVSVIFLVVGLYEYSMPLSRFAFMAETDETILYDCFSHIKAVAVIVSACVSALLLCYYLVTKKRRIRKSLLYIPLGIYAVSVLLSYAFSDYKEFAFWGNYDRFEGTIVHLCYIFMFFYTINCIDRENEVKIILNTLFAAVTVACLIGLTQLLGYDFFSSDLGRFIMLAGKTEDLEISPVGGGVYQTVYNMNYVAFYLCLVIPSLIERISDQISNAGSISKMSAGQGLYTGWLAVLTVLIVVNIAGAGSIGSLPGIIIGVAVVVIIKFSRKIKALLITLAAACVFVAVMTSLGYFGTGYSLFWPDVNDRPQISYIRTCNNTVEFMINDNKLITKYESDKDGFTLQNEAGEYLDTFTLEETPYRYDFEDDAFNGVISFEPIEEAGRIFALFRTKDMQWLFEFTDSGAKYINSVGNQEELDATTHADIIRNYSFGNGRGYIWDTTIPVISMHPFIGSGADTFMYVFPQNDYATRYSHEQSTDCVYDKPHNMFLQLAVSFGLTGLTAFLSVILLSFLQIKKAYSCGKSTSLSVAVFAGIISFLVAALVNDSSVSVMPMFFGLLGCIDAVASSGNL